MSPEPRSDDLPDRFSMGLSPSDGASPYDFPVGSRKRAEAYRAEDRALRDLFRAGGAEVEEFFGKGATEKDLEEYFDVLRRLEVSGDAAERYRLEHPFDGELAPRWGDSPPLTRAQEAAWDSHAVYAEREREFVTKAVARWEATRRRPATAFDSRLAPVGARRVLGGLQTSQVEPPPERSLCHHDPPIPRDPSLVVRPLPPLRRDLVQIPAHEARRFVEMAMRVRAGEISPEDAARAFLGGTARAPGRTSPDPTCDAREEN